MEQIPLHPIELKVLSALEDRQWVDFASIVSSDLHPDQVRRSLSWLSSKKLVELKEDVTVTLRASTMRPPELLLIEKLRGEGGEVSMTDLRKVFDSDQEFSAAVGRATRERWVEASQDRSALRLKDHAGSQRLEDFIGLASKGIRDDAVAPELRRLTADLVKRGLLIKTEEKNVAVMITDAGLSALKSAEKRDFVEQLTPEMIASGRWKTAELRPIDVEAAAPAFHPGRRHPVRELINEVREVYLSMGFTEITGDSIQTAFWNFDALFTPQDHPARELQDTFYVKGGRDASLSRRGVVARVASAHENGWTTGSRGWRYSWGVESGRRLVLRTHNTVLTIRATAASSNMESRVFSVGRVYRNENLDYKHLAELHQMEGIIIGEGLNVKHLMGVLTKFYAKLGMSGVKLWPSYFPYTEPSLQVMTYNDKVGKWLEMGGSGIFRPEVTLPLGVKKPVLAWGCGLERLLMLKLGIEDIRELYNNDLGWLRRGQRNASS
ncbi:MAG: phenylalanine--tRNA ligase subunit alpha [Thaumarchaeota archaeon]|nr:phenylalanine--tRNA ligase subunit alpha [Nitrososphaerota archaeon]